MSEHIRPNVYLRNIGSFDDFQTKILGYVVETSSGCVTLNVTVPYRSDDREADHLGRIELRKILAALAMAA